MGKKTRSKQSVKVQEKDVRNKKELLVMAANLVQSKYMLLEKNALVYNCF